MNVQIMPIKRVLLVAPQPFYDDRGTPIAIKHVLKALLELGYHVDVLTYPMGENLKYERVRYFRSSNPLRIRSVPIGFSWRKVVLDIGLNRALKQRLEVEDYVCIHAVEEAAFFALHAARKKKIPVIYDMQSSMAEQMAAKALLRNPLCRRLLYACEQWLIQNANQTMCSAGLAGPVRRQMPDARIQEWNYPGLSGTVSPNEVSELRQELNIHKEATVVLYTGNFAEYQGVDLLVDAMAKVYPQNPDTVLVLVGYEKGKNAELVKRLETKIPKYGYRLIPRQPKSRIGVFMELADIVVSPRAYGHNLPLKVLEYLGAGCVIVATDIEAHRCILNKDLAVLTEASADGLAGGIAELIKDPDRHAALRKAAREYAHQKLGWVFFVSGINDLLFRHAALDRVSLGRSVQSISVIIPVRNAEASIAELVGRVKEQEPQDIQFEIVVVDDGSTDRTVGEAEDAGARVIHRQNETGNPAAARNLGAREAVGELLVFLDDDCTPGPDWMRRIIEHIENGEVCVGGALAMPSGMSITARADYYNGWYHVHEKMPMRRDTQHPPCNLAVLKEVFLSAGGYCEEEGIAYSHEELQWQAKLKDGGQTILFDPQAYAEHRNRPGFRQILRRNYRWAYHAIESKAKLGITRWPWLYRYPVIPVLLSLPLIPVQVIYITACWIRAGKWEALLLLPWSLAARSAYGIGMFLGGIRWMVSQRKSAHQFSEESVS